MTICIFTGPTIGADEARQFLDATYFPPAAQGDVYRIAQSQPFAIGIIDGYFHKVPSVWHKEILWAMSQGVHVFGSASMGALRAAELHQFGMIGVGDIFDGYATGKITDDDEVAVIHGPMETGYVALSEAMVNIRATLVAAHKSGIISGHTMRELEHVAKALFFPERSYDALLKMAAKKKLPDNELNSLGRWLTKGRINSKKNDSIAMLRFMNDFRKQNNEPKQTKFFLENTYVFD